MIRIYTFLFLLIAITPYRASADDAWLEIDEGLGYYDYFDMDLSPYIHYGTDWGSWTTSRVRVGINGDGGTDWEYYDGTFAHNAGADKHLDSDPLLQNWHSADWVPGASVSMTFYMDGGAKQSNTDEMMIIDLDNPYGNGLIYNTGQQLVMQFSIDVGTAAGRQLTSLWVQNQGTLQEGADIGNDKVRLYYENGTELSFDGTESSVILYGDHGGDATNNETWGDNTLALAIPDDGTNKLLCYVVIETFEATVTTGRTADFTVPTDQITMNGYGSQAQNRIYSAPIKGGEKTLMAALPVATGNFNCGPGMTGLSVTGGTTNYFWYDGPSPRANLLGNGSPFTTPYITATTSYYVAESGTTPNALDFDGYNDYVTTTLDIDQGGTQDYTVETWVKLYSQTDDYTHHYLWSTEDGGSDWGAYLDNSGNIYVRDGGGADWGGEVVQAGTWTHLAFVFDATSSVCSVFVDGEFTRSFTIYYDGSDNLFSLGARPTGADYFLGMMDEVRVWDDMRSPEEIRDNMYTELTGAEANLVAYYQMDDGSGTTLTDLSGGGYTGTLNNMDDTDWAAEGPPLDAMGQRVMAIASIYDISAGPDKYICTSGGNVLLSASGGGSYSWSTGAGSQTISVSPGSQTTYTLTVTNAGNECTDQAEVFPFNNTSASDNYRCGHGKLTLTVSGSTTDYQWYDAATDGNLVASGTTFETPYLRSTTTYYVAPSAIANMSISFDGFSQYITTPYDMNQDGTSSTTVEMWVKPDNVNDDYTHHYLWSTEDGGSDWGLYFDNGGRLYIRTGHTDRDAGLDLQADEWQHVALVFDHDDGHCQVFLDGVGGTVRNLRFDMSDNNFALGARPTGADFFPGLIDEVRVWKVARTQQQIIDYSNQQLKGDEDGLDVYYQMADGSGTTLTDITGNGHDGTLQNMSDDNWNDEGAPLQESQCGRTPAVATIVEADAGRDQFVCTAGGNLTFTASGGSSYAWSTGDLTAATTVTPASEETYRVTVTSGSYSCVDSARALPYSNLSTTDNYRCGTGALDLTVSGTGSIFQWYDAETGNNMLGSGTTFTTPIITANATYYAAAAGIQPTSLHFDAYDDYLQTPYDMEQGGTESYTIEMWVKPDHVNDDYIHHYLWSTEDGGSDWGLYFDNGGRLYIRTGHTDRDAGLDLQAGTWQHVAVVFDHINGFSQVFLDGAGGTQREIRYDSNDDLLTIGSRPGGNDLFPGYIDEVRVWQYARLQSEIQEDMYYQLDGDENGLELYYRMDDGSGTNLSDLSGKGNDATLTNMDDTDWAGVGAPLNAMECPREPAIAVVIQADAGDNEFSCSSGQAHTLTASGGTSYNWSTGDATAFTNVSPVTNTTYYVTVSKDGYTCTDSIDVYMPLTAHDSIICSPGMINLHAEGASGKFTWYEASSGGDIVGTGSPFATPYLSATQIVSYYMGATDFQQISVDLDGTNDFIETYIDIDQGGTQSLTVELWVKPATVVDDGAHHYLWSTEDGGSDWGLYYDNGGRLYIRTGHTARDAGLVLTADTWQHVAVVFDHIKGFSQVYLDGTGGAVCEIKYDGSDNTLNIGKIASGSNYFEGLVDEFRVWTYARSEDEINSGMSGNITGSEYGLQAYYRMDENTGTTLTDLSGNGYTASITNIDTDIDWAKDGPSLGSSPCALTEATGTAIMADAGPSKYSCTIGETHTLTASGGGTYLWSTGDAVAPTDVSPIVNTDYYVTVSNNSYQCIDTTHVYMPAQATGASACENGRVTLSFTAGSGNYRWYDSETSDHMLAYGSSFLTPVLTTTTTYYIESYGDGTITRQALNLDGVDDYIVIPPRDSFALDPFTLELWVWVDHFVGNGGIVGNFNGNKWGAGCTGHGGWVLRTNSDQTIDFYFGNGCETYSLPTPSIVHANTWNHFAITVDGADVSLYMNGQLINSDTFLEDIWYGGLPGGATILELTIGRMSPSFWVGGNFFNGKIDELRIWDEVRTPTEIADHYKKQLTGWEDNLYTYYRMDNGPTDSYLEDASPNDYTATWYNMHPDTGWYDHGPPIDSFTTRSTCRQPVVANVIEIDAGIMQEICTPAGTVNLTASGGGTYDWSTGDATQSITVGPTETTLYYVTVTKDANTCRDSVVVFTPFSSYSFFSCGEGTLSLDIPNYGNYKWYDDETGGTFLDTGYTFTTPPLTAATTYHVSMYDSADYMVNSVIFDGTDNYAVSNQTDAYRLNVFTVETWVYVDDFKDKGGILGNYFANKWGAPPTQFGGWALETMAPDAFGFRFGSGTSSFTLESTTAMETSRWYHVAVTYENQEAKLYVDGQLENSNSFASEITFGPLPNGADVVPLHIGSYGVNFWTGGDYFDGMIDDVRIWDEVRSQEQIEADRYTSLTGSEDGLVSYFPMNTGSDTVIQDYGPYGYDVHMTNMDGTASWADTNRYLRDHIYETTCRMPVEVDMITSTTTPTGIAPLTNNEGCVIENANGWVYVFEEGTTKLIMALQDNVNNANFGDLGLFRSNLYVDVNTPILYGNPRAFMERRFTVDMDGAPGASGTTLRFYFTQEELDSLISFAAATTTGIDDLTTIGELAIAKYEGPTEDGTLDTTDATSWIYITQDANGTEFGANYIDVTVSSFSEIWGSAEIPISLPIVMNYFEAQCFGNHVLLQWQTASEYRNDYFFVEKSTDGIQFEQIARIAGAGNSNTLNTYTHIDENKSGRTLYYRLKQVDYDGGHSYSEIIRNSCGADDEEPQIWYNAENRAIEIEWLGNSELFFRVNLYDQAGKSLINKRLEHQASGIYTIAIPDIRKGLYYLHIVSDTQSYTKTIFIH